MVPPGRAGEDTIVSADITLAQCKGLKDIEVTEGSYWEEPVKAVLRVKEVFFKGEELLLKAQILGTQSEGFLKAATTWKDRMVEVHLCGAGCPGTPHVEGYLHVKALRRLGDLREGWMTNLVPEEGGPRGEDQLADLRADMAQLGGAAVGGQGAGRAEDALPMRPKEKKRSRSRRRKKKSELKVEARKDVSLLLRHTGADPDPSVRRKFRRKAAKLARQKRAHSSSSDSSSSGSSLEGAPGDNTLFGSASKVQVIGRRLPGTLVAAAIEEASESLISQEGGTWETDVGPLPAIFPRYYRQQLSSRMSPAMARETQTLCQAIDYLLKGRCVEALDLLSQRVKALEMQMTGVHFTVAQQQEILPREMSSISTTPEFQEAARRAREEGKARLEAARPYGARGTSTSKGEEWTKGAGKKGQGKGKTSKGDQRKGEGNKDDAKKAKGG